MACACVAGVVIEYFIFGKRQIDLAPSPNGWIFREAVFLFGSILAGTLTRFAARKQRQHATAALQARLQLAEAQALAFTERDRANELAKENEVRVDLALDGANAGLWEWDIRSNRSKWSPGFYRLHGLAAGGLATFDVWHACLYPADIGRVDKELQSALEGEGILDTEYRVVASNGELRWIACRGRCTFDDEGKPDNMVGYCGDVTRRKQASLALIHTERLAAAGRLAASIAHEIKNPLEAALNMVYLARTASKAEEKEQLLAEVTEQLLRVSDISQHTLQLARAPKRAAHCHASEVVGSTLKLLRPKLQASGTEIKETFRSDPRFLCFTGEIQQILTNLISNANDSITRKGVIRIRVSESRDWRHPERRGVRFTVADNGTGMTPEVQLRMKDAFFSTKGEKGTGLGLWVVSTLIERHDGIMSVRSSTDPKHSGTVFSVFIPAGLVLDDRRD
jgi:PAS domain S-box-containing protein